MAQKDMQRLAYTLRSARERLGLSANEVARRAHLDQGTVSRIEHAQIDQPRVDSLIALGLVLSIPASDLFILAHWLRADDLPDLAPYMHAKYPKLPESAYQEIGEFFTGLWRRYRVNVSTPEET